MRISVDGSEDGYSELNRGDDEDWVMVDDGDSSVVLESYIQQTADAKMRLTREEGDVKAETCYLDELRASVQQAEADEAAYKFRIMNLAGRAPAPRQVDRAKQYLQRHDDRNRRGSANVVDGDGGSDGTPKRRRNEKTKRRRGTLSGATAKKKPKRSTTPRRAATGSRRRSRKANGEDGDKQRARSGVTVAKTIGAIEIENEDSVSEQKLDTQLAAANFDPYKPLVLNVEQAKVAAAVAATMVAYDEVIHATQSDKLDAQFEEIIQTFEQRFLRSAQLYRKLHPPSRGNVNRDPRTPKFVNITTSMVEYLREHRDTLRRMDEQAFESQHHAFKEFSNKRRIARATRLQAPKPRSEQRYEMLRRAGTRLEVAQPANSAESKTSDSLTPSGDIRIFLIAFVFFIICVWPCVVTVSDWWLLCLWFGGWNRVRKWCAWSV